MTLMMDWFRANKLSLNILKTVVMKFWLTNKNNSLYVDIADVKIPIVQVTKFLLGVYLDEELNWKYHANQVYNKIQSNKQLLTLSKNVLGIHTLIKVYYAHIYSHLNYGLVVWRSMLNTKQQDELFKVQKSCIRIANKKKKNSPTDILFKNIRMLKFPDMIKLEIIKFGYKLSKQNLPGPIETIMNKKGGRKTHQYPTCNQAIPNIQKHNSTQFNNSYLCKGVSLLSASKVVHKRSQKPVDLRQQLQKGNLFKMIKLNGTTKMGHLMV